MWLLGVIAAVSILIIASMVLVKVQYTKIFSGHNLDCIDTSLHDALNDENRRKIVRLLRENGDLSYTELMKAGQVYSSGQMNYHLTVLGDLLATNDKGQYYLTEKGVFAYTSLNSFQNKKSLLKINTPWRQWIGPTIFSAIYLIGIFFLYSRGVLDFEVALLNLLSVVLTSSALFYLSKVKGNLKLDSIINDLI